MGRMDSNHMTPSLIHGSCPSLRHGCAQCQKCVALDQRAESIVLTTLNKNDQSCRQCNRVLVHSTASFIQGFLVGWVISFFLDLSHSVTKLRSMKTTVCQGYSVGRAVIGPEENEPESPASVLCRDMGGSADPCAGDILKSVKGAVDTNTFIKLRRNSFTRQMTVDSVKRLNSGTPCLAGARENTTDNGCHGSNDEEDNGYSDSACTVQSEKSMTKSRSRTRCKPLRTKMPVSKRILVKRKDVDSSNSFSEKCSDNDKEINADLLSNSVLNSSPLTVKLKSKRKKTMAVKQKHAVDLRQSWSDSSDSIARSLQCSKDLVSERQLEQHMQSQECMEGAKVESSGEKFTCEVCAQVFMTRSSVKAHIRRKHSGEEPVECDVCSKMQPGTFALGAHKKACHGSQSLCHICGAAFYGRTSFDKHMVGHAGVRRHVCKVCGAGFVHGTSLRNHLAVHLAAKTLQCHVCPRMFKTRPLLNEHLLKAHQTGPSLEHRLRSLKKLGVEVDREALGRKAGGRCLVCGEALVGGRCPSHPDSSQEVFQCQACGDLTSSVVLFHQHLKWHRGQLSSHKRRTATVSSCGDAPVSLHLSPLASAEGSGGVAASAPLSVVRCEVCSKTFSNWDYLSAHMHQHREARFACPVCFKPFTYKCNLKSHMNTHSDTWQFQCDTCSKQFRDKHAFKKHQLKHTEPQFKCEVCGKALTRRPYLIKHYRKIHPEYQYQQATQK